MWKALPLNSSKVSKNWQGQLGRRERDLYSDHLDESLNVLGGFLGRRDGLLLSADVVQR